MRLVAAAGWVVLFSGAALLRAADSTNAPAAAGPSTVDPLAPYEHWITGDIFVEQNGLFFRTDRPVRNNPAKNVVVLAVTADGAKVLLPMYVRAAERHVRVRLFGALIAYSGPAGSPAHPRPNVEFLTWKAHAPSDPDVLAPGQRIAIDGGLTTVGNVPVTMVDDKTGKPLASEYTITTKRVVPGTATNSAP